MEVKVIYPFKMIGRYEDGAEVIVGDDNEENCMCKLCGLEDKHGSLIWYSCYCDEDYVDEEYVGRDNFIYDQGVNNMEKVIVCRNINNIGDLVKCSDCGMLGFISAGGIHCPFCESKNLQWYDNDRPEWTIEELQNNGFLLAEVK